MNIGDTLRTLVEINFPDHVSRTVTYSAKECELQVKFNGNKHLLPTSDKCGWLIAEALKQMHAVGYTKLGNIWTSIEAGIKMSITIKARIKSQYDQE